MTMWHRFARLSLDLKLIASYLVILGIGGLAISVVGSWIVSTTIRREAQRTVSHDLALAEAAVAQGLSLTALQRRLEAAEPGAAAIGIAPADRAPREGWLVAELPLVDGPGEPRVLWAARREDSYAAARNRVISSFFAIATVGFALVIAITYRIIHALTRPIREMVEATRRIAAGRFDHPVRVTSGGEIGLLGESINRMQASLQEMRSELEEAARTLEDKVRARSEELGRMQARMAQSERLASIGVLAAGVAHEINNPLGGILALTSLTLEDLPPTDPSRENLEEVVRQTRRCGEIVRHLLEFSRQHEARPEPTDLDELLARTLALLERQSIFHNIRVERDLQPHLPPVVADPSQLQQVFVNILMNAVQAMAERGTLTIATAHDVVRDEVVLSFHDTGCGIPADKIGHVFDPFFTTKGSGEGTGLGLSIAYGIVSRHRGTIGVESEPGVGTTFTIRLPVAAPQAAVAGADEAQLAAAG